MRANDLHVYYERDTVFIDAQHQAAMLIDLALSREIDSHALLRGSQLFLNDLLIGQKKISAEQFIKILANCQKQLRADDTSFLLGQRILPGFYGPVSQALNYASDLQGAINHLCQYHAILTPLLTPRCIESDDYLHIYWLDNCGAGRQKTFLIETYVTAVYAMSNTLSEKKLPWRFTFTHQEPDYIEQYWVHLNENVYFNQQFNMMSIQKHYLQSPCPKSAPISLQMAEFNSKLQLQDMGMEHSFLDMLYDYLKQHIQQQLYLDEVAKAFGMSPATFKRKLFKHETHFQEQLDLARKHVALYLFQIRGYQHQQVADYLRFNDLNNFRRAFKRWTGFSITQLQLQEQFL